MLEWVFDEKKNNKKTKKAGKYLKIKSNCLMSDKKSDKIDKIRAVN